MNYVNLVTYMQKEINNIFRLICKWARAYMDNNIYKAKLLDKLIKRLTVLFKLFIY